MHQELAMLPYDTSRLLEFLLARMDVKRDRQLAQRLGVSSSIIHGIRMQRIALSGSLLTRMADCANCAVDELRFVLGDRRRRIRLSHAISAAPAGQHASRIIPPETDSARPDVPDACACHGGTPERRDMGVEQAAPSPLAARMQP